MASNVSPPWIYEYFLDIAETHGGNLMLVPPSSSSKKVQLIKFLTYQTPEKDSWIWAVVSDKTNKVIVRFTKHAMNVYREHPIYGGNLFSSYKTALIQIKRFHPMFARVPRESDGSMSKEERLVLEVDEFMPMGSFGANVWQSPTYIEATEEMELWMRGMRAGAGGGNVLMTRKIEREQPSTSKQPSREEQSPSRRASPPVGVQHEKKGVFQRIDSHHAEEYPQKATRSRTNQRKADFAKARRKSWAKTMRKPLFDVLYDEFLDAQEAAKLVPKNARSSGTPISKLDEAFIPRTPRRKRNALDLSTSPASSPSEKRASTPQVESSSRDVSSEDESTGQRTPSQWSPSVYGGTQRRASVSNHATDIDQERNANLSEDERMNELPALTSSPGRSHQGPELSPEVPLAELGVEPSQEEATMDVDRDAEGGERIRPDETKLPSSSYLGPTPAQRPRVRSPFSSSLPTPGNVLVLDSTQLPPSQPIFTPPSLLTFSSPLKPSQYSQSSRHLPGPSQSIFTPLSSLPLSSPIRPFQYSQSPNRGAASDTGPSLGGTDVRGLPKRVQQNRAFSGIISNSDTLHGRILVPNSDTSGTTASQSQSQPSLQHPLGPRVPSPSKHLPGQTLSLLEHPSSQTQDQTSQVDGPKPAQDESQESQGLRSAQSLSYTSLSQSQSQGKGDIVLPSGTLEITGETEAHDQNLCEGPQAELGEDGPPQKDADPEVEALPERGVVEPPIQVPENQNESGPIETVEVGEDAIYGPRDKSPEGEGELGSSSDDSTEPEDESAYERMEVYGGAAIRPLGLGPVDIEALKQEEEESQSQPVPFLDASRQPLEDTRPAAEADSDMRNAEELDSDDERTDKAIYTGATNEVPAVVASSHEDGLTSPSLADRSTRIELTPRSANTSTTSRVLHSIKRLFSGGVEPSNTVPGQLPIPSLTSPIPAPKPLKNKFHDAEAWKEPSFMRKQSTPRAQPPTASLPSHQIVTEDAEKVTNAEPSEPGENVSKTAQPATTVHERSSTTDQRSIVTSKPGPLKKRKRRTPLDSPEQGGSAQPMVVKKRRVVGLDPISAPSLPETSRLKVVLTRPDHTTATKKKKKTVVEGSAKSTDRDVGPSPRNSTLRQRADPVVQRPKAKAPPTKIVPAANALATSSDNRKAPPAHAVQTVSKSTSASSLSVKAKSKQPMRPSGVFEFHSTAAPAPVPPAAEASSQPEPRPVPKLGGAKLDLSMTWEDGNGLLMPWSVLDSGLLELGRLRYKERKAKLKRKESAS